MGNRSTWLKAITLPAAISSVLKQLATQKKFLREHIDPLSAQALAVNDGSLGENDINKINQYYGMAVPAILGEAFCALRGKAMSDEERWASTCQGSMTGLFDDFFDKDYLQDELIEKMISANDPDQNKRSNQKLFDVFYRQALKYVPGEKLMKESLKEVYKAQVESKKQVRGNLSTRELTDVTFYKGGTSLLFYRTAFSPAATGEESKLIYGLGGLMQLANDIFDVFKDREANIQTLVTATKQIAPIRELFSNGLSKYYKDAMSLGLPKKNIHRFMDILSIGIFSRCFVCLYQLEQNEKLTGNEFLVTKYSRQQLICDMDKRSNLLRSAHSHVRDIP